MDKIVKLLQLTTSSNDFEALNAIRTANQILTKNKTTWLDLFNNLSTVKKNTSSVKYESNSSRDKEIISMLEYFYDRGFDLIDDEKTSNFTEDLIDFYEMHSKLSEKQFNALKKIYSRIYDKYG